MPASQDSSINSVAPDQYDDPLFLSNSDYPAMTLVNSIFDGKNFLNWSRGVVMALGTKNKQGFLDSSTAMPALTSPSFQKWLRADHMVRCWILNALAPEIKQGFMTAKSTKRLWEDINNMYGQSNAPLLFQLKKELKNTSQAVDQLVVEYYNKLKCSWDDIEDLEMFPDYTCGALAKCPCSFLKKILEVMTREKVMTFLMGLDSEYKHLKTNILSMDSLPNLTKAYSLVQQIESQKRLSKFATDHVESSAMAASRKSFPQSWNK
ncbi:uncharacterized protein LOC141649781 [Silene latifolia]|uniref:uncharacterized protein LOC141649781 n=1 Tax=Silene latifolia TaxID=37657 RepID=UPI003D76DBAE